MVTTDSPIEVVHAYYRAIDERRWDDAVAHLHPSVLPYIVWKRRSILSEEKFEKVVGHRADELTPRDAVALLVEFYDLQRRLDEWIAATIERYPQFEAEIIAGRAPDAQTPPPSFVGEIVEGDTAYLVPAAPEVPAREDGEAGVRLIPLQPTVLRIDSGRWKIMNDLVGGGAYVRIQPIEVVVDGVPLRLEPEKDWDF